MSLIGSNTYGSLPNITGDNDANFNDITVNNISVADKLLFEQADANDEGNMTTYIFQDPASHDLVVNNDNPLGGFKIQWGNTPDTSILSFRIDPYNQKLEYPVGNDPEESITFGELNALKGVNTNVTIQQQIDTIVDITAGGGYWGTFYSDIDQFSASANTPYIATLNNFDAENDGLVLYDSVGLGNYNSVKVLNQATYNIQLCFQVSSTSSSTRLFRGWFRVNGTDIPASAAGTTTHNNDGYYIVTFNVIMPLDTNDIVTLMWATDSTTQHLEAIPVQSSPFNCPLSPSVYLSFQQVTGYQDNSAIVDDLATKVTALEYKTQDQSYSNLTYTTTFGNALTAGNTVVSRLGIGKPVSGSYAIDASGSINITGTYQINGVPISGGFVYGTVSSGTILTASSPNLIGLIRSGTDYTVYLPGVLTIPQGKIYQFFPKSPFPAGGVVYINGRTSTQLILINGVVEETVIFTEQIQNLTFVCISNTPSSTVPCWAVITTEYFADEYMRLTSGVTNNINSTNNFYGNSEFFGYATFSRIEGDSVALKINGGSYLLIEGGLLVEGVGISPLELSHLAGTVENIQTHFDNLVYSYMGLGGSNESNATNYFYQTQTFAKTEDEAYGIVLVAGSKLVLDGELYVNSVLISPTELSRLTGVSSNIQTQINNLVSAGSGYMLLAGSNSVPANNTYTGINTYSRTAGDAVALTVSGGSKLSLLGGLLVSGTTISPTELSRLTGVSSNIQTQINNLISSGALYMLLAGENSSTANNTYTGTATFSRTTGDTTALLVTSGSVLRLDGSLYVSGTVITPLELSRLDGITYNIQDQINAITTAPATNIAGGGPSKLVYQTALNTTGFIDNGTAGQLLKSNGSSAPSWVDFPGLTQILQKSNIGSGINIYSGPVSATRTDGVSVTATVDTNSSTMLFDGKIGFGETDFVNMRGSGEGGFYFYSSSSNTVNYSTPITIISRTGNITATSFIGNATSSTNISGGGASKLVYQTATNTTGFIDNGTAGQVLTSNGSSAPSWVNPLTITNNTFTGTNTFENPVTLQATSNFNFQANQLPVTILNQYFQTPVRTNQTATFVATLPDWTFTSTAGRLVHCRGGTAYNSQRGVFPISGQTQYLAYNFNTASGSITMTQNLTFTQTGDYLLTYYAFGTVNAYSGATESLIASISGSTQTAIFTEGIFCLQKMRVRVTDISVPIQLSFVASTTATVFPRTFCIYGIEIEKCIGVNVSDGGITNHQLIESTGINTTNIFNSGNIINFGKTLLFGGLELYNRYAPSTTLLCDSGYGLGPTSTGGRVIAIGNGSVLNGVHLLDVMAIGVEACQNVGPTSFSTSYANANVGIIAIGYRALRGFNGLVSTGSSSLQNYFIGHDAGYLLTIPSGVCQYNLAVGYQVLNGRAGSTNIQYNALFGHNIMATAVTASSTIQGNSVFGNDSFKLARGANNTSVGYNNLILATNTATNNNTFLGANVCNTQSGSSNVMTNCSFIGSNSDVSASGTYSNSTCLGYNSRITASNQLILGTETEITYPMGGLTIPSGTTLSLLGSITANALTVTPTQLSFLNQVTSNQIPAGAVSGLGLTQVLASGNNGSGLNAYLGPVSVSRVPGTTVTATVPTNTSTMLWDAKGDFGETDFVNQHGTGAGGFYFYSTSNTTVNYNTPITIISKLGNITTIGDISGTSFIGSVNIPVSKTLTLLGDITANSLTVTPTQLSYLNQVTANKLPSLAIEDMATRTPSIGASCSFLGYLSGDAQKTTTTTGVHNVGIGTEALKNNDAGSYNTAIGSKAGVSHETGDYCSYVGYLAGAVNTGSNSTIIGANSCTTQTNLANATVIGQGNNIGDGNTNAFILGRNNTISANNCGIIGNGITNSTAGRITIGGSLQTVFVTNYLTVGANLTTVGDVTVGYDLYVTNGELKVFSIFHKKYYASAVNPTTLTGGVINPSMTPLYEYNRVNLSSGTIILPLSADIEVGTVLRFRRITNIAGEVSLDIQSGSGHFILGRNAVASVTSTVIMGINVTYASVIYLQTNLWAVLD